MFGIGIVELFVLGILLLAAVAIAMHKPGALLWIGALLLFFLFAAVGVWFLSYYHVSQSTDWSLSAGSPQGIQWSNNTGQMTFTTHGPPVWAWGKVFLLALVVGGALLAALMMRSQSNVRRPADGPEAWHENRRRGGWGWLVSAFIAVAVLGVFLMRVNAPITMQRRAAELSDNARRQMEVARLQAQAMQQQSKVITQEAQRSIQDVMNDFAKPRITLNEPAASKSLSFDEAKNLIEGDKGTVEVASEKQVESPTDPPAAQAGTPPAEHGEAASAAGSAADHSDTPSRPASVATTTEHEVVATAAASKADEPATPPAEAKQTSILKIHFSDSQMRGQGVSFAQVAAAFLRYRRDYNIPVRIDGEKKLIEIDANSELASQFSEMKLDARVMGGPSLSKFADSITTTGTPSVITSSSGMRPSWVDEPLRQAGNVTRQVIVSGDYKTVEECYRRADEQLIIATWNRVAVLDGRMVSYTAVATPLPGQENYQPMYRSDLERMGVGIEFIRRELVPPPRGDEYSEYLETIQTQSVGPMQRLYTLMEFTPSVDERLRSMWVRSVQGRRVEAVVNGSSIVLAIVGLIYGLLKVDTWTKGYYSKRLFLGVPALIAAALYLIVAANH